MCENDLGSPNAQVSAQIQLLHHNREQQRFNGLDMENNSAQSTVGNKTECIIISHIRARDVAIKLRHIPVGFYVTVESEDGSKRTSIKPVSVGKDVVQWDDEIVLPSNRSSRISFSVVASFELGPILGNGEVICKIEFSVDELLVDDGRRELIKFLEQKDGEAISSPSSFEIEVERRAYGQSEDVAVENPPASKEMRRLEELTEMGHHALICYREHREQKDLDESITHYEHARDLCPLDNPSRAAVLFHLATAKLVQCRENDVSPDLDVPIDLYRAALRLRPYGHPDHPFTLLSLGVALEARFQRQNNNVDREEGRALLSQVQGVAPADSYAFHAAALALSNTEKSQVIQQIGIPQSTGNDFYQDGKVQRLDAALQWMSYPDSNMRAILDHLGIISCIRVHHSIGHPDPDQGTSRKHAAVQLASDGDPDIPSSSNNLEETLSSNKHLEDLAQLEKLPSMFEDAVRFTPDGHPDKHTYLNNLGYSLSTRYDRFGDVADLDKSISISEDAVQLTPDNDPRKPLRLNSLGISLLTRYKRVGDAADLEKSISMREAAVQITPDGDPDKPLWLGNLGSSLLTRYRCFGDDADLEKSISIFQDAVRLTPDGHPDKLIRLNNLGDSLLTRYRRFEDVVDLDSSISTFEEVMQSAPDSHPNKHSWIYNLSSSLLTRYERLGDTVDLDRSISMGEAAVQVTPDGYSDKPSRLNNLGYSLLTRYQRSRDVIDIKMSISMFDDAVRLSPDGDPDKRAWLTNLCHSLSVRYQHFGDVANLDRSISVTEDVIQLTSDEHPDRPSLLNELGSSLLTRYQHFGDVVDMERSISVLEVAMQFTSHGHPERHTYLNNLAHSLSTRYERFGDVADLEKSISIFEGVVQFVPDSHPNKPAWLSNLGTALLARYRRFGDIVDLEKSISLKEVAVQLTPDNNPNKSSWLNNLGRSLSARHQHLGHVADLEKSIAMFEDAVQFAPDGHPEKPTWLTNLGLSLLTHHQRSGDIADLERAISILEETMNFTPDGHPDRPLRLNNLGHSLLARFERFGDVADLEKSISLREDVVQLTPDGHPDRPTRLNNLGHSLWTRYQRFGNAVDLERTISLREDTLQLTPDDHPDKHLWLNNLAHSFLSRYERFGDVVDLEKSVSTFEDVVGCMPDGHPDKPSRLDALSSSLLTRYDRFGDAVDLERSILLREDAAKFTPDGHPDKPSRLSNLGHSLLACYQRFGDATNLEKSISMFEDAVQCTPDGHPDKPPLLNNLGHAFSVRCESFPDVSDLEKSISLREAAVQFTPDGHPYKHSGLYNLGNSLLTRYERLGDEIDLEKAISMFEDVVECTPDGHPDKPSRLNSFAFSLLKRFQRSSDFSTSDISRALFHSSRAARSHTGPIPHRVVASHIWIQSLRLLRHDPESLLDAYTVAVDLLPQLSWIALSLRDRHHQLLRAANEACDAAAAALDAHRPELAVEWLEQGRSVMWSQFSQLRTPVNDIRAVHPELAAEFERVSHELEYASAQDSPLVNRFRNHSNMRGGSLEKQARQHNALALSRDRLLAEIRALPGFERFLLPKTIHQLSSLAHSGHVVYLNASKYRCDALVVVAGSERVIHVPLSNTDYDEVAGMQLRLNKLLRLKGRDTSRDERGARLEGMRPDDVFGSILPYLWNKVAGPILDVLDIKTAGRPSRIFWCPTGPFTFLPIHAAGIYHTATGPKLSDFVISSYIPTMSALEMPPQEDSEEISSNVRLLAVPQPSTDGQAQLNGVPKEIDVIKKLTSLSPFAGFREADGTIEDVLAKMAETDWVHFACHGIQDRANPFDSGFPLANRRRLKLSDIVRLSRRRGGLAFLSACHTATGDEQLSEEAIHIAAGMLLAGYNTVIATLWTILDTDAPRVTEDVYKSLFRDRKVPDGREAAEALHNAIGRLRDSGAPFLSWVPFIHVGL